MTIQDPLPMNHVRGVLITFKFQFTLSIRPRRLFVTFRFVCHFKNTRQTTIAPIIYWRYRKGQKSLEVAFDDDAEVYSVVISFKTNNRN
jgi:hypothetical protein